jgi:hypothetical protein
MLTAIALADTWSSDPALDAFEGVLGVLSDDEAAAAPSSIGQILPLLVADRDRLRLGLELVVRLDLVEALAGLQPLLMAGDQDALLAAASQVNSPQVPPMLRDVLLVQGSDLDGWARDIFLGRVDPTFAPETDVGRADKAARWPTGHLTSGSALVGVEMPSDNFSPKAHLAVVVALARAGCLVRRVPTQGVAALGLPSWVPVIGPSAAAAPFRVTAALDTLRRRRLLAAIAKLYPVAQLRLDFHREGLERRSVPLLDDIEVFDAGAIPRREVQFLSASGPSRLARAKDFPALAPREFRGLNYWTFSQLVGLRVAAYLFRQSGRPRGLMQVANDLVDVVRSEKQVPVAVTSTGAVVVERHGSLHELESGQVVMGEVVAIDEIYQPFPLGGGAAPALLQPSGRTAVHPSIARGLPCVAGTRIPVGVIGKALSSTPGPDGPARVANLFELDEASVEDARTVSSRILAYR